MSDKYATAEEKVSYGIGRQMGEQLAGSGFDGMVFEIVAEGLVDSLHGRPSVLEEEELREAYSGIAERVKAKKAEEEKGLGSAGEQFLIENAKRDEVTVTASGLQFEVLTEGNGEQPGPGSTVRTHYHGTLIDGSVFDSSVERGQPAEFPVNGVIAGWTEALQLMPVGSKWKLFVPYGLAYGEQGAGGAIGPYSTLVFEVELLDIVA